MIKKYLHTILFFCLITKVVAQTISYHKNYDIKDGLPSNELYWVTQSKDGMLWVGSDAGLIAYDGLQFKTYSNKAAKNSSVNGIVIDEEGRIWAHNFANQLFCFQNDSLHLIKTWEDTVKIGDFSKIAIIDSNRLYLSLINSQSYIYHIKEDSLEKDSMIKNVYSFNPIWMDEKERLILRARYKQSTYLQHLKGQEFQKKICKNCYTKKYRNQDIRYVLERSPKGIIFYVRYYSNVDLDSNFHYFFEYTRDSIYPIPFPSPISQYKQFDLQIINTHWQGDSILWLATSQGIFSWNIKKNTSEHYLKNRFISDVYCDMEGNIWGTSTQKGLFFISSKDVQEHHLNLEEQSSIQSIEKDHLNNLLLGHSKYKITYFDGKTNAILHHTELPNRNIINLISFDPIDQVFWIITDKGTPMIYNPKTYQLYNSNIPSMAIKNIIFDAYQNLYCATGQGAILISKESPEQKLPNSPIFSTLSLDTINSQTATSLYTNKVHYFINAFSHNGLTLSTQRIRSYSIAIQEVPTTTIWIGTTKGLIQIIKGKFHPLSDTNGEPIIANDLLIVNDTTLWVASNNKGIFLIQNGKIKDHINVKNGLPTDKLYKLAWQAPHLWIGSEKGIIRYAPTQREILQWSVIKGLPINKIKNITISNNRIYINDGQQLLSTSTKRLDFNPFIPLIEITHFEVNNQEKTLGKHFELTANENSIKIGFQGVSLKSQGTFTYLYRLLGTEQEWIKTDAYNNIIRYPQLSAGSYRFEVKMIDPLGNHSTNTAQISFTILPPFYKTGWFLFGVLASGSMLIWFLFKWQIHKIEITNNERERKNQLALERSQLERDLRIAQLKAIKAQMNPHFVFNILNSIQGLYIINDKKKANLLLSQFSLLIRSTLDRSETLEILLEEEVNFLKLYLEVEHIRVNQNFDYSINLDPLLQKKEIYIPSLLLQPYIENALKHGLLHQSGEKKLTINLQLIYNQSILKIIIDDTGIGRNASNAQKRRQHNSFSISANTKRLQLLNSDKEKPITLKFIDKTDVAGVSLGTTVILQIPID